MTSFSVPLKSNLITHNFSLLPFSFFLFDETPMTRCTVVTDISSLHFPLKFNYSTIRIDRVEIYKGIHWMRNVET